MDAEKTDVEKVDKIIINKNFFIIVIDI